MKTEGMVIETKENDLRMESCPHFDTCDAPKCPLDSLYKARVGPVHRGKDGCRAHRATRMRLGAGLLNRGLFPTEMRGIERYYGTVDMYCEAKGLGGA